MEPFYFLERVSYERWTSLEQFASPPHSFGSYIVRIVLGVIFATGCTTALAQSANVNVRISDAPSLSVTTPLAGLGTPELALPIDLPLSIEADIGLDASGLLGALPAPGLPGGDLPIGQPDLPIALPELPVAPPDLPVDLPLPIPAEVQDALATVIGALPVGGGGGSGDGADSPVDGVVAVLTDTLGAGAGPADIVSAVTGLLSGLPVDTGVVIGLVDQVGGLLPVAVPTSLGGVTDTLFAVIPPEAHGIVAMIPLGDVQTELGGARTAVVDTVGGAVRPIVAQISGASGSDGGAALAPVSDALVISVAIQLQALGLVGVDVAVQAEVSP